MGKKAYDFSHWIRLKGSLMIRNLILIYNIKLDINISLKLKYKWISLYWIVKVILVFGIYIIIELNGT